MSTHLLNLANAETLVKTFKSGGKTTELWAMLAGVLAPTIEVDGVSHIDPMLSAGLALAYLVARTGLKWIRAWRQGDVAALTAEARRLADELERRK